MGGQGDGARMGKQGSLLGEVMFKLKLGTEVPKCKSPEAEAGVAVAAARRAEGQRWGSCFPTYHRQTVPQPFRLDTFQCFSQLLPLSSLQPLGPSPVFSCITSQTRLFLSISTATLLGLSHLDVGFTLLPASAFFHFNLVLRELPE